MNMEHKFIPLELDEKALAEGKIVGMASVYDNVDLGGDKILPGAFKSALNSKRMPKMLWQHNSDEVIGIWESLEDTPRGLKATGRFIEEVQRGKEARILLKEGAIDGLSIGYRTREFSYEKAEKGTVRLLKAVDLHEISVVTFPMNPKALVTDVKQLQTPKEVEAILRDAGVPANFAKLVASHGFDEAKKRLADSREEGADDDERRADFDRFLKEIRGLQGVMKNAQG